MFTIDTSSQNSPLQSVDVLQDGETVARFFGEQAGAEAKSYVDSKTPAEAFRAAAPPWMDEEEWNTRLEVKAAAEWSKYAQEPVTVQVIGSAVYAFGSEFGMLRLYYKMGSQGRVAFSTNLQSWYWVKD